MLSNITLIQPARPVKVNVDAEEHWQLCKPFSLFYLAAALNKTSKYLVNIIDLEKKAYQSCLVEELFYHRDSLFFGITATTYTRFEAIKLAKILKELYPTTLIVVGGVHFSYCDEDTLKNIPEIDIVVRGEGELTIVELADAISEKRSFEQIAGITYRHNEKIIRNIERSCFVDVDNISAFVNYSYDDYPEYLIGYPKPICAVSVMSSRGCPYQCIFCAKGGTAYRLRNTKSVVDEIAQLQQSFSIEGINFLDLTLTASPKHVVALCQEISKKKLEILWWCESRANIPLNVLSDMKNAGCASIALGVESGSQTVLSRMKKNITIKQVKAFCHKARELGIYVQCYFIFSHPDETEEEVEETLKVMVELSNEYVSCSIQPMMIFPGTEIEKIAIEKKLLPPNFSWSTPYESLLNKELRQLSNCPLYIDSLAVDFMRQVQKRLRDMIRTQVLPDILCNYYSQQSLCEIIIKTYKHLVIKRLPLPDNLSWQFFAKFILQRLHLK